MIGSIVFRLQAHNDAQLPKFHGRLMHGLLFHLLQTYSPELATIIHDEMETKPFTVSLLFQNEQRKLSKRIHENFRVRWGDLYYWRVTALHSALLQALLSLPMDKSVQVGDAVFDLQEIITDGRLHTGIVDEQDLVAGALSVNRVQQLDMRFTSPVSFRYFDKDYPFPVPALVFSSLADKWTKLEMPAQIDRNLIREVANNVVPREWNGGTHKVYFAHDRGMLAFTGRFCYDLTMLTAEQQQIFLLLAQFAEFAGVGRLTAQGFGQTRMTWK